MSRSPLAYPLNRAADTDVGGAADLQTDIMRFMAILSLCLVAIFALVQSIPLTPTEPVPEETPQPEPTPVVVAAPEPQPVREPEPVRITRPEPAPKSLEAPVVLTRPKWQPAPETVDKPVVDAPSPTETSVPEPVATSAPPAEADGFTLRFASDTALTRAVAAHHVGFYAIEAGRAQRMTVSESRISFWDASTPNAFHEMEAATVPAPVIDALARTGVTTGNVNWGVTLPGKMKAQLEQLMREHPGGSLIIGAAGEIHWEAP